MITAPHHIGNQLTSPARNSTASVCKIVSRPTTVLSIAALSLGLTGLGSVAAPTPTASAAEAEATAQGSFTDALEDPATMEFTAAPTEVSAVDNQTWESEHVGPTDSPYQAFQLEHPGDFAPVTWTGLVDPAREVKLLAWNTETKQWDQLRNEVGAAPENTILEAYVSEEYADEDGQVYLAVTGEDTQISGSESWAPDEFGVTNSFADPAEYDFSIAHVTDTQFLSEGAADPNLDTVGRERFAQAYREQMNWIVDNAAERKISYVAHTGDIIENWMLPHHPEEQAREEFEFASQMQSIIDDAGIPNGIIPGNHDNGWGTFGNDMFNDYFPAERYEAASQNWQNASYGGPWEEGDNSAHYDLFEAEGHQFIALYLPYGHNTAQRNWANEILQSFPDRDALIFTHAYLRESYNDDASKAAGNIGYGDNGHLLRTQVVEQNDNIAMVSSGHYHGTAWNHNFNGDGGPIFEMLGDYQDYEVGGERNTGFMRLLQFDIAAGEVKINTYSPKLDEFGATAYDTEDRSYTAATDEYTAPLSLSTRGTTLMTDQMYIGDQQNAVTEPPADAPTPEPAEQDTPESETAPEQDQPQHDLVIGQQADVAVPVGEEIEPVTLAVNDDEAYVEFSGLPTGLIAVPDERSITGTPQAVGEHEILVTATDRHGRQQQMSFVITVEEPVEDEPSGQLEPEHEPQQEPQATTPAAEDLEPVSQIAADTAEPTAQNNDTVEVASTPDDETQSSGFGTGLADTGTGTTVVFVAGALVLVGLGSCALLLHRRRRQS